MIHDKDIIPAYILRGTGKFNMCANAIIEQYKEMSTEQRKVYIDEMEKINALRHKENRKHKRMANHFEKQSILKETT